MFTRSNRYSSGRPPSTPGGTKLTHIRRSSSSRSIGQRADWEANGVPTPRATTDRRTPRQADFAAGEPDEDEGDYFTEPRRANSIGHMDEEALRVRQEADRRVHNYVTRRLERLRTSDLDDDENAVSGGAVDEIGARE